MTQEFVEKYGKYEEVQLSSFKHISEASTYNHNYYVGLKNGEKNDILYVETDECTGISDFYVLNCIGQTYIGFAYEGDEYMTLSDEYIS